MTVAFLKKYVHHHFGASLGSIMHRDNLLYADFLPDFKLDKGDDWTIFDLLRMSGSDVSAALNATRVTDFIELKLFCERHDSLEGQDSHIYLPNVKVAL